MFFFLFGAEYLAVRCLYLVFSTCTRLATLSVYGLWSGVYIPVLLCFFCFYHVVLYVRLFPQTDTNVNKT